MESFLEQTWQEITAVYTKDQHQVTELYEALKHAYSGPERHYHTLHHIAAMLRLADQHKDQLKQPDLVKLAIFFHDAVYVSTRTDNEEKSAQLAQDLLPQLGLPTQDIAVITEMILATKTHDAHPNPDINLLLDFDLAILGAPWPAYQEYSRQIRQEYHLFSDHLFQNGRKKVLRYFLAMESLYHTPFFKANLEHQARENMQRELTLLDQE